MRGPAQWTASHWAVSALVLAIALGAMLLAAYRSLDPRDPPLTRATTTTTTTAPEAVAPGPSVTALPETSIPTTPTVTRTTTTRPRPTTTTPPSTTTTEPPPLTTTTQLDIIPHETTTTQP